MALAPQTQRHEDNSLQRCPCANSGIPAGWAGLICHESVGVAGPVEEDTDCNRIVTFVNWDTGWRIGFISRVFAGRSGKPQRVGKSCQCNPTGAMGRSQLLHRSSSGQKEEPQDRVGKWASPFFIRPVAVRLCTKIPHSRIRPQRRWKLQEDMSGKPGMAEMADLAGFSPASVIQVMADLRHLES